MKNHRAYCGATEIATESGKLVTWNCCCGAAPRNPTPTPKLDVLLGDGHAFVDTSSTHRVTRVIGRAVDGIEVQLAEDVSIDAAKAAAEMYLTEHPTPDKW